MIKWWLAKRRDPIIWWKCEPNLQPKRHTFPLSLETQGTKGPSVSIDLRLLLPLYFQARNQLWLCKYTTKCLIIEHGLLKCLLSKGWQSGIFFSENTLAEGHDVWSTRRPAALWQLVFQWHLQLFEWARDNNGANFRTLAVGKFKDKCHSAVPFVKYWDPQCVPFPWLKPKTWVHNINATREWHFFCLAKLACFATSKGKQSLTARACSVKSCHHKKAQQICSLMKANWLF